MRELDCVRFATQLALAAGTNVLWIGPPGTGKSSSARMIAESLGITGDGYKEVLVPACVPEEFARIPVVTKKDGVASVELALADEWVRMPRPALVLLDEIKSAPTPEVRAALLGALAGTDPRFAGIRFIATANPVDEAEAALELSPALRARLCILQWNAGPEDWVRYIRGESIQLPRQQMEWYPNPRHLLDEFPVCVDWVASWVSTRQQGVSLHPDRNSNPRAWTWAAAMIAVAHKWGQPYWSVDVLGLALTGLLGDVGVGFATWVLEQYSRDPQRLIRDRIEDMDDETLLGLSHLFEAWLREHPEVDGKTLFDLLERLWPRLHQAALVVATAIARVAPHKVSEILRHGIPEVIRGRMQK